MTRVEWTVLDGTLTEDMLAVMICRRRPEALQVRPSRGDYGIDLAVPAEGQPEANDIVQVKKYATTLNSQQKVEIERSLARLMRAMVERGERVVNWYLVMPLNPTNENRDWFTELPELAFRRLENDPKVALGDAARAMIRAWIDDPTTECLWCGRSYCEGLASEFQDVVDYYVGGGSERLRETMLEMSKTVAGFAPLSNDAETQVGIAPAEISGTLFALQDALDKDPHFRYEIELTNERRAVQSQPGMIAATQKSLPDGRTITVKIFPRFKDVLRYRPIPIEVQFEIDPESQNARAYDEWLRYGKPFTASASVKANLPGGFDGTIRQAMVSVGVAEGTPKRRIRFRIVRPDGSAGEPLMFVLVSAKAPQGDGFWFQGVDGSGLITVEILAGKNSTIRTNWSTQSPVSRLATEVTGAVNFASMLGAGNRLEVAGQVGPFSAGGNLGDGEPLYNNLFAQYVSALAAVQEHTGTPLLIPALGNEDADQVRSILRARKLLIGEVLLGTWAEFFVDDPVDDPPLIGAKVAVRTFVPFSVVHRGTTVALGALEQTRLSARRVEQTSNRLRFVPCSNDTVQIRLAESTDGVGRASYRPILQG